MVTEDSCFSTRLCYCKARTGASCLYVIASHLKARRVGTEKDRDTIAMSVRHGQSIDKCKLLIGVV